MTLLTYSIYIMYSQIKCFDFSRLYLRKTRVIMYLNILFSGLNEVKVIVRVTDLNDNAPKFMVTGRPIVAAIPATASYGYEVMRLQVSSILFMTNLILTKYSMWSK